MTDSNSKSEKRLKERLDALVSEMIDKGIVFDDAITHFETQYITKVLKKNEGNRSKTARVLGIHRNTLSSKLERRNR